MDIFVYVLSSRYIMIDNNAFEEFFGKDKVENFLNQTDSDVSNFNTNNRQKNNKQNILNNNLNSSKQEDISDNLSPQELVKIQEQVEKSVRDIASNEYFKQENISKLKKLIQETLESHLSFNTLFMNLNNRNNIQSYILNELIGFGPLEPLLKDEAVTEIMVIDKDKTFIEKNGEKILSNIKFKSKEHIKLILDRIIGPIGRKIDEQTPLVDARLPQGFRLNAVIDPVSLNGIFITIRKFPKKVWTPTDLIKFKSAPKYIFDFLELCVKIRKNICVSGGTGSGKTTLLNVISNCIPEDERIIVIEDCAELRLVGEHILYHEARPANTEGKGAITIRDLVKNALRQRPDRIVVGEVRGGEALDMLQAMNTGHDGSMTTGHANSPIDFMRRLEYMCLCAGGDMPLAAIKPQIASAVNIVVQIGRVRINGKPARRILEIDEVLNEFTKEGNYILNPIYKANFKGSDKYEIEPTGYIPTFIEELETDFNFDRKLLNKPKLHLNPIK